MLISAFVAVFDGMSVILCGQLRAIGRPMPGSVAMFLGHYLAGLPSGIALGFGLKLEIYGVWMGLASTVIHSFFNLKLSFNSLTLSFSQSVFTTFFFCT
jgi:Na+-driven multidrug efflux pump